VNEFLVLGAGFWVLGAGCWVVLIIKISKQM
jgi:hypothetical protein